MATKSLYDVKNPNADHIAFQHNLHYRDAMAIGMPIGVRAARRHAKWVYCSSDKDDLLQAAYDGILHAWKAWKGPEVISWEIACWTYGELYARREANRRKSVVSTGSAAYGTRGSRRRGERDEGMVVRGEDGEWTEREIGSTSLSAEDEMLLAEQLRTIMVALREAVPKCAKGRDGLAHDVIAQRIMTDAPVSAATIASTHGVTSQYVYKIEAALKAAASI
mgnify:CR=1 FL=1